MIVLNLIFGAVYGAALGSFLGCAAYRLPRRYSLRGRSFCPNCQQQLRISWNIPVFSWLWLRGRSRCCSTTISRRYLLYELATMVIGAALGLLVGWLPVLLLIIIIVVILTLVGESRTKATN